MNDKIMLRCAACNGSGEGRYDGTKCISCGGSGSVWTGEYECPECNKPTDNDRALCVDCQERLEILP